MHHNAWLLALPAPNADVLVSVEQRAPGGLSVEDWALLTQVLEIIKANVTEGSPAEIFSVIAHALRAHYAKAIDG